MKPGYKNIYLYVCDVTLCLPEVHSQKDHLTWSQLHLLLGIVCNSDDLENIFPLW